MYRLPSIAQQPNFFAHCILFKTSKSFSKQHRFISLFLNLSFYSCLSHNRSNSQKIRPRSIVKSLSRWTLWYLRYFSIKNRTSQHSFRSIRKSRLCRPPFRAEKQRFKAPWPKTKETKNQKNPRKPPDHQRAT